VCCHGTSVVADCACRECLLADVHSCLYTSLQASYAVNSQGCCMMQQLHMQHQDSVGRLQSVRIVGMRGEYLPQELSGHVFSNSFRRAMVCVGVCAMMCVCGVWWCGGVLCAHPFLCCTFSCIQAGKFVAVVECILISRMAYALGCSTQLVCLLQVARARVIFVLCHPSECSGSSCCLYHACPAQLGVLCSG
jgi:hypothetical protein